MMDYGSVAIGSIFDVFADTLGRSDLPEIITFCALAVFWAYVVVAAINVWRLKVDVPGRPIREQLFKACSRTPMEP